jgi:hypothetical protein
LIYQLKRVKSQNKEARHAIIKIHRFFLFPSAPRFVLLLLFPLNVGRTLLLAALGLRFLLLILRNPLFFLEADLLLFNTS